MTLKRFGRNNGEMTFVFLVLRMLHASPGWCFEMMVNGTTGENVGDRKSLRSKSIAVMWKGVFYIKQESNFVNWWYIWMSELYES